MTPPRRRAALFPLVLAASLAALAATGCETTHLFPGDPEQQFPEDEDWRRSKSFAAPSFEVVWQRATDVLATEGFRTDESLTTVAGMEIVTLWVTHLAPTRYEGKRRRAHVKVEPVGTTDWAVAVSVIRQRNADIDDPSNPVSAQWEADSIDANRVDRILWRIENSFRK